MGTTGYIGVTTEEAKAYEVSGFDVVCKSGNWWLCVPQKPTTTPACLFYFRTSRHGGEVAIKTMNIDEGPFAPAPSKKIVEAYIAYFGGDVDRAGGRYGAPILRDALAGKQAVKLTKGQKFVIDKSGRTYPFGSADRTYTYLGGFLAMTEDGQRVRLWKTFRKNVSEVIPQGEQR